ncbi:PBECR2 nuclease fold domain-containing protein, partial [Campylobacter upsaliensis]
DEVLEAEVIEEVGLNEPMKFLEFQQRKLLTYIKENTPLKLLEHKKELKTRDILNFLEQSALNGKQKVFLMRNLERDLGKLEAQLKEAEEVGFKEAKNAVDDDFLKGYDEKIKQNIKSLEFENELIENPRPRGREPQDRYISLAYFMANFAQHYKLLDLKNPRTKEQIELLENALKKQNIGYEVLENEPVAIRYFKKEWVNSQEAKIKEAVKNHNAIYKEILDNDYIFTDERSEIFRKRERELIENLAKDEKVQAFTSQWGYPFKKDGELRGIGLNYKAKVYGKGEHKMMYVDGGGFGSKTFQKKKERLLELEKERLQEAFKADFGIDGFISKYVENEFFKTLWGETKAYKGTDYGWGVHPREYYPYYENRIMPSDTITQAKEKLQKEKSSWSVKRQETKGSEDIIFTDKKGKEHTLTKETQKAWLEAFNLKSLEDSYIPNHNEAIKQALEGKEIKLQLGSLKKLVAQGREKYIPQIKEVLDRPEAIMRDDMGEYLFIKHLKDDDYFVNVSFDNGEYLVSISNGIKETRNLNNKLKKGGEFIYQSPNFNFISQKLLQTSQYSANKIDED